MRKSQGKQTVQLTHFI